MKAANGFGPQRGFQLSPPGIRRQHCTCNWDSGPGRSCTRQRYSASAACSGLWIGSALGWELRKASRKEAGSGFSRMAAAKCQAAPVG